MEDLEKQLKAAFVKIDPSPGFEAKVVSTAGRRSEVAPGFRVRARWLTAVAAAVLVAAGAVWQQEVARGEAAKARLMLALKITGAKLQEIQQKVDHAQ
jgi:hypothetical protein